MMFFPIATNLKATTALRYKIRKSAFFLYLLIGFLLIGQNGFSQPYDYIVGQSTEGAISSIGALLRRLPSESEKRIVVFIENGVYYEKLILQSKHKNISFIGENRDSVIIKCDDYAGLNGMSSAETYTFMAAGDDFYAENITFLNFSGDVGQALAIRTTGNRQVFNNCKFLGFQDTYYAHKNTQYNYNCYVEGGTDFIYGDATAVFDSCVINCVKGGQYITAPADTKLVTTDGDKTIYHGLLFLNCDVTAGEGVGANSYYLMRPWQPNASTVYIQCTLGEHIKDIGWSTWGNDKHLSGCYAEFENKETDGNLVDVSQRAEWSKQFTQEEVDKYYNLDYFLKKGDVAWNPKEMLIAPVAPNDLKMEEGKLLWAVVEGVRGYLIYKDGVLLGFSESSEFADVNIDPETEYVYMVKAMGANGNLSAASETYTFKEEPQVVESVEGLKQAFGMQQKENMLFFNQVVSLDVFTIKGRLVWQAVQNTSFALEHFSKGIYIVKATNTQGKVLIRKISL